jgi:hypothetical protein
MFSIESGAFLNNPLSFCFNTAKQIFLILHVFNFQGSFRRQTNPIFLPNHFWENRGTSEEKSTGNTTRHKRGGTTWADMLATWWAHIWLMGTIAANFGSMAST